jgi:hypothetical protein
MVDASHSRLASTPGGDPSPRRRQSSKLTPARTCDEVLHRLGDRRFQNTIIRRIDDPHGPLAHVSDEERAALRQLVSHRDPKTAEITLSVERLGHLIARKDRKVRYLLDALDEGPTRRSDGMVVEGRGFIQREKRWRPWGGQASNAYVFTCKFWLTLEAVAEHNPEECASCRAELARAERRGRTSAPRDERDASG